MKLISPLEYGRRFLARSQVMSLMNLTLMDGETVHKVLESLELTTAERITIYTYLDSVQGLRDSAAVYSVWVWYFSKNPRDELDPYIYCYTPDLQLTQLGQRMKDDAYRAQATFA